MSADDTPKLDGDPREFLRAARKAFDRGKRCVRCDGRGFRMKNVYRNVYHGRHLFPFKTFVGTTKVPCARCAGTGRIHPNGTHE